MSQSLVQNSHCS